MNHTRTTGSVGLFFLLVFLLTLPGYVLRLAPAVVGRRVHPSGDIGAEHGVQSRGPERVGQPLDAARP